MAETIVSDVLIGGRWVPAAGGTYPVIDPGDRGGRRSRAGSVGRARRARRRGRRATAFEHGPWPRMSRRRARRAACARRRHASARRRPGLVDLDHRRDRLAARRRRVAAGRRGGAAAGQVRRAGGAAGATRRCRRATRPGGHRLRGRGARAGRRGRLHHALQLPDDQLRREDRPGAGVRQHGGREAGAGRSARAWPRCAASSTRCCRPAC